MPYRIWDVHTCKELKLRDRVTWGCGPPAGASEVGRDVGKQSCRHKDMVRLWLRRVE